MRTQLAAQTQLASPPMSLAESAKFLREPRRRATARSPSRSTCSRNERERHDATCSTTSTARADEFIGLRRDIHRHPELAFEEHRTAALVADKLQAWGYEVERGLGGTGVVGRLVRGDGGKRLGLRADMDALPIDEATGLS